MPWSGSGVYTRGYASWTADASNNLPISATKFDTEDNDFAAGIQNCLTIDNQNKPNATLTWAQTLNLTKGTDSNVFSIGRTGGTNNPSLTWSLVDAAKSVTATLQTGNPALVLTPGTYSFGNTTDNPTFTFTGGGMTSSVGNIGAVAMSLNGFTAGQSLLGFSVAAAFKGYLGFAGASGQIITGSATGDMAIRAEAGNILFSVNAGTSIAAELTSGGVFEISDNAASNTLFPAGYLGLPQNSQAVNYTTVLADRAKQICHNSPSPHTYTIAANASVAYAIGDILHFVNPPSGGALTIAINSDILTLVPTGTTGSRTLLAPGIATAEKIAATSWVIYGSNLS